MSNSGNFFQAPANPPGSDLRRDPVDVGDVRVPLLNLSTVRSRMDSLQRFLTESVNSNTLIGKNQMDMVSTEISAAIHQIIVNGAALLACTQLQGKTAPNGSAVETEGLVGDGGVDLKFEDPTSMNKGENVVNMKVKDEEIKDNEIPIEDWDIVELDAVELLAEHIHFCDICGKGFKRDANLRMHMRAHGNQFKTTEALAKPESSVSSFQRKKGTRFSCPFSGCNRNKSHRKFRPLKSAICVKNHFKRSHCPKMYACNRCNKKSFSVVADLKSHLKHCGESKWKCSCGTSFSRKDKLFGHVELFEGHMPLMAAEEEEKGNATGAVDEAVMMEDDDDEDDDLIVKEAERGNPCLDSGFFDGLLDGFGSIEGYCFQDVLQSPTGFGSTGTEFFNF